MGEDASLEDFLDADTDSGDERRDASTPDSKGEESGDDDSTAVAGETTPGEAGGDGTAGDSEDADNADGGDSNTEEERPSGAVEPAVTTYAWSPEGAACAECGEVVERRWIQGGDLVCGACKSW
ncbi:hypothetical protein [Haloarcula sp. 1CSR25-25]|uniref:DUF7573 domain-containing protein n=1 Tax=Haloarcula sp. 1CSR25-25 TaxID=2862545 RepID=UPI002894DF7A|nr:hypothetical protein [Haloarcula sp. 1CSR25-25]MDT3433763.1 hypothetical protein [Haloarcula sp. 1CSR25-25]